MLSDNPTLGEAAAAVLELLKERAMTWVEICEKLEAPSGVKRAAVMVAIGRLNKDGKIKEGEWKSYSRPNGKKAASKEFSLVE